MSAVPGFLTICGDAMQPTLRSGDTVGYSGGKCWVGDALYVLDRGDGPTCMRAGSTFDGRGTIRLSHDNERYTPFDLGMEAFVRACRGRVFAICRVVDGPLMHAAGVSFGTDDEMVARLPPPALGHLGMGARA